MNMIPHAKRIHLSRREFILGAIATGLATVITWKATSQLRTQPIIMPRATFSTNRVVHVHNSDATNWDYATGWYGDSVNQTLVDVMTDRGVIELTNTTTRVDAWHALMPTYTAGQKVAIKINLNNATSCGDNGKIIDALPQPINSVIQGLKAIGVAESDI